LTIEPLAVESWVAAAAAAQCSEWFSVRGIPTLIIVGPDGRVITERGRASVDADPTGSDFPWYPSEPRRRQCEGARRANLELLDEQSGHRLSGGGGGGGSGAAAAAAAAAAPPSEGEIVDGLLSVGGR
jgi:hypothetical protein